MGRRDRAARGCAALLAVMVGATAPSVAAAAAPPALRAVEDPSTPPQVPPAELAAERATPAIVEVDVRWQGLVYDRTTRQQLDPQQVSATLRCIGAGVGGAGYLLTTATCLDQASVAKAAFQQIVDRRVANGSVTADHAGQVLADLLGTAMIGADPDNPTERTVTVRRAVTDDDPMPATVVSVAKSTAGDAALLKINRSNQPMLALADDGAAVVGDEAVTLQLPAAPANTAPGATTDTQVRPTSRSGSISSLAPQVVVTSTDPQDPSTVLPGGVVVSDDATIVGIVDGTQPGGGVLVPLPAIRTLLTGAAVDTNPGQVDRDYRAGLDAYYAGRYTDSIEKFDSVLAIIPSHVQAHDFRARAQSLRQAAGGGPAPADSFLDRVQSWVAGQSGVIVGVGVLLAIAFFFVRRRHPHGEAHSTDGSATDTTDAQPCEGEPTVTGEAGTGQNATEPTCDDSGPDSADRRRSAAPGANG
jgi:hypothetical protein